MATNFPPHLHHHPVLAVTPTQVVVYLAKRYVQISCEIVVLAQEHVQTTRKKEWSLFFITPPCVGNDFGS